MAAVTIVRWVGDLHAQRDEKQGDEKISDIGHLGDHVDIIWKGGDADAGNERSISLESPSHRRRRSPKHSGKGRYQQQLRNLATRKNAAARIG